MRYTTEVLWDHPVMKEHLRDVTGNTRPDGPPGKGERRVAVNIAIAEAKHLMGGDGQFTVVDYRNWGAGNLAVATITVERTDTDA